MVIKQEEKNNYQPRLTDRLNWIISEHRNPAYILRNKIMFQNLRTLGDCDGFISNDTNISKEGFCRVLKFKIWDGT